MARVHDPWPSRVSIDQDRSEIFTATLSYTSLVSCPADMNDWHFRNEFKQTTPGCGFFSVQVTYYSITSFGNLKYVSLLWGQKAGGGGCCNLYLMFRRAQDNKALARAYYNSGLTVFITRDSLLLSLLNQLQTDNTFLCYKLNVSFNWELLVSWIWAMHVIFWRFLLK